MAFELPKLDYDYSALEPYIDEQTMRIHHEKHHGGYVNKLNAALESYAELQGKSIEDLLRNIEQVPEEIRQSVINNGGGHTNHSLFWEILTPNGGGVPNGELSEAINKQFSSFENFRNVFNEKAVSLFGSGWVFLVADGQGDLMCRRRSFQNSPYMHGNTPILGIDLWEHAYYLKYQNERARYIEAFWNVINWERVNERFKKAVSS